MRAEQSPRTDQGSSLRSRALATIAGLTIAACKVGPDYHPPETPTPSAWAGLSNEVTPAPASGKTASADASRAVAGAPDVATWWGTLNDATLTSLIVRAASANLDVQQAEARIRQARATRTIAGAGLWPTAAASASVQRSGPPPRDLYRAGFDAAWELDVFGGVRRGVEAADADLSSAVEDQRAVLVSLAAEVATTYFDLRGAQEQLAIAARNLDSQLRTEDITRLRHDGGFVSGLDVANAEAQVASTRARIPTLEQVAREAIYALSVLLGQEPGSLVSELSIEPPPLAAAAQPPGAQPPGATPPGATPPVATAGGATPPGATAGGATAGSATPIGAIAGSAAQALEPPLPKMPPQVPVGLPSDLLRRRPDIRKSEADLHAATARIGVAEADYFPKFSLTGSVGLQGGRSSSLTSFGDRFWSIGPSVSVPVFTAGRVGATVDAQRAFTDQTLAAYRKTVLVALQEVENALVSYAKEQERRAALADALNADVQAVDIATQLYTAGKTDFLNVLTAERLRFEAEDALAQSSRQVVQNLVALYKSLGGGWDEARAAE
jgi:multidrug efflux system outer membrane protein